MPKGDVKNFWTTSPTQDPKRGFRFRVTIGGIEEGYVWYAKKSEKPQVSFTEASHSYLNHTYYWPARTEWNEVSVTFVDPVNPDLAGTMGNLLETAGYAIPENTKEMSSMSKVASVSALENVMIEQIDENGASLETWTLYNAWVKEVTFGELDYGNDELTEMTMKFRYDWASLETPEFGKLFSGPSR